MKHRKQAGNAGNISTFKVPTKPAQTAPSTRNQVFGCPRLWKAFLIKSPYEGTSILFVTQTTVPCDCMCPLTLSYVLRTVLCDSVAHIVPFPEVLNTISSMAFGWYILKARGEGTAGALCPLRAMHTWLWLARCLVGILTYSSSPQFLIFCSKSEVEAEIARSVWQMFELYTLPRCFWPVQRKTSPAQPLLKKWMEKSSADPEHRLDSFQQEDPDCSHKSFALREVIKMMGNVILKANTVLGCCR